MRDGQREGSGQGQTIALVCNSSWAMVNFRLQVMKALRDEGHEVVVIAPEDGGRTILKEAGIELVHWALAGRGTNPFKELGALVTLSRILRGLSPDRVFCYTIKPVIYGSLVAPHLQIYTCAVITGLGYAFLARGLRSAVARALYRVSLRRASEVWFLNEDDRALFAARGLLGQGVSVVLPGEGVDCSRFSPRPSRDADGRTVFLLVSRLLHDKGIREYIEAARIVRSHNPMAIFRIAGPFGPPGPGSVARSEIESLEAAGTIEYLGSLDDVRPAIAEADFVVLPSYREGIPRALLEAASMGKPLVATDVPGCRDVAREGVNAFLAPPRNPSALAEAIEKALGLRSEEAVAMGMQGRDIVLEQFGDPAVIAEYKKRISERERKNRGA